MLIKFKKLNDETLMANTKGLVERERLLCAELLAHFAEVDERRLYANEGFPACLPFWSMA